MKISNKVKLLVSGLAIMAVSFMANPVSAVLCPDGTASSTGDLTGCSDVTAESSGTDAMEILNVVVNVVLGVIGFVAVFVIILGGVQYTTSAGDTAKVTKAKNTIMYGIIGLVIALLAFAIVNFVLSNVFGN